MTNATTPTTSTLLHLTPDRLLRHPKNMRTHYGPDAVREMADSLRARGNVTPLSVIPNGKPGHYYVVRGNLRLAGAELAVREGWQGTLRCEVVSETEAEALTGMVAENLVGADIDPVSEARHYKRLQDDHKMSPRRIAAATGVDEQRIRNRLALPAQDEPILDLIADDKLTHDIRVARALLTIADKRVRVQFAERMQGRTIAAIIGAAASLNARLNERRSGKAKPAANRPRPAPVTGTPMVREAAARGGHVPPGGGSDWDALRATAAATCRGCEIRQQALKDVAEPAWALISHAAGEVCGGCSLREIRNACATCPAVELLTRLVRAGERSGVKR